MKEGRAGVLEQAAASSSRDQGDESQVVLNTDDTGTNIDNTGTDTYDIRTCSNGTGTGADERRTRILEQSAVSSRERPRR